MDNGTAEGKNAFSLAAQKDEEKEKLLEEISSRIKREFEKFGVTTYLINAKKQNKNSGIELSIYDKIEWYHLEFNSENFLELRGDNTTLVYEEEQILHFLQSIQEDRKEKENRAIKKQKIFQLQLKTIETKVDLLAKKLEFTYFLEKMKTKIKLGIILNKEDALFIDIPYGKFQEILPQLEKFIQMSLSFNENGLKFTVRRY